MFYLTTPGEKGKFNQFLRRFTIAFIRYNWDKQRPAQLRQLFLRLFPLTLILVLSIIFVWTFSNANLRNRLNRSVFNIVASQTVEAVENYFTPLIDTISSSVLWGAVGEIDSLGDPETYIGPLSSNLESIGTIASMNLTDSEGMELVIDMTEGGPDWYATTTDSEDSLTIKREAADIEYRSLNDRMIMSTPYRLPTAGIPGITLSLSKNPQRFGEGLKLSLDLPLVRMADRLRSDGAVSGAVIFILMPSEQDFIFLPVDALLKLEDRPAEELLPDMPTPFETGSQGLIDLLLNDENFESERETGFRFEHDGRTWFADFLHPGTMKGSLAVGVLVPEESLWLAQLSLPLQIILFFLLGASAFLLFRLVKDYLEASRSPFRTEEILREQIAGGESAKLEFKSSLRWDYREDQKNKALEDIIVKSVAAFNNADGGTLLIGVADDGEVLGIEKDYAVLRQAGKDYYEIHLRNLLGSKYGTGWVSKNIAIDFPWLSGHEVCRINIRRGRQPLYTLTKSKSGGTVEKFFIRSGNTSQVLENPSEITNYILTRFSRWRIGKSLTQS